MFTVNVHFLMKLAQYNTYLSKLWILMAWCFSTRTSVVTVLSTHPCFSSWLCVNQIIYNSAESALQKMCSIHMYKYIKHVQSYVCGFWGCETASTAATCRGFRTSAACSARQLANVSPPSSEWSLSIFLWDFSTSMLILGVEKQGLTHYMLNLF